ncbi:MAG: histidine kinase [Dokdonella sp.]
MSKHFLSVLWLVLLWWTAYALMFATQVVSMGEQQGNPTSWNEALRYSFGGWMTWVPLSMVLYWLVFHFPIERGRVMRAIPVLLAGVALVVVVRAIYVYLTNPLFGWYPSLPPFTDVLWTSLRNNLMMAMTVVGVSHALVFYRQAREREHKVAELESHLARTRLDMLRAQLNPHFLFNALNSVAEMVHQDADMADRMLVSLSALLRDSLSAEQMQLRPLRNELAVVNHYLTIEKIRLGDRLQIEWNIDDRCLDVATPMLILQPLVENAIVHAIARQRTPSTLRLCGRLDHGMLVLDVENTLVVDELTTSGTGIGLRSIRDRLQLLYAERAQLLVRDAGPGVFAVELRIPMRSNALRDVPMATSSVGP